MDSTETHKAIKATAVVLGCLLGIYHLIMAIRIMFSSSGDNIFDILLVLVPFLTLPVSYLGFRHPKIAGYIFIISFCLGVISLLFSNADYKGLLWFFSIFVLPALLLGGAFLFVGHKKIKYE